MHCLEERVFHQTGRKILKMGALLLEWAENGNYLMTPAKKPIIFLLDEDEKTMTKLCLKHN